MLNSGSIAGLGAKKLGDNGQIISAANALKFQQGLRVRWTKKDQFVVENLYVFECQTAHEVLELFKFG